MTRLLRPATAGIALLLTCGILGTASPAFADKSAKASTNDKSASITVVDDKSAGLNDKSASTNDKSASITVVDDKSAGLNDKSAGIDDKSAMTPADKSA